MKRNGNKSKPPPRSSPSEIMSIDTFAARDSLKLFIYVSLRGNSMILFPIFRSPSPPLPPEEKEVLQVFWVLLTDPRERFRGWTGIEPRVDDGGFDG